MLLIGWQILLPFLLLYLVDSLNLRRYGNDLKYRNARVLRDSIPAGYIPGSCENNITPFKPLTNKSQLIYPSGYLKSVKEVNCAHGKPLPSLDVQIPYDQIQVAVYEGSELLKEVLGNLKSLLDDACKLVYQRHQLKALETGDGTESSKEIIRSIKCLLYWIGNKLLYYSKISRGKSELKNDNSAEDNINERNTCESLIREFIKERLIYWYGVIQGGTSKYVDVSFPEDYDSPEDYVFGVWTYLNKKSFNNLLPEFWELEFNWSKRLSSAENSVQEEDDSAKGVIKNELFSFLKEDRISLPTIVYPQKLASSPSALGNCIFRSMVKLFCDLYSSKFEQLDYCSAIINAFNFVESRQAYNDGVNFTTIQRSFNDVVNHNAALVAIYNSMANDRSFDVNYDKHLYLDVDLVPYIKNVVDNRALSRIFGDDDLVEFYDSSFKVDKGGSEMNGEKRDKLWSYDSDGNMTIPLQELRRCLLRGNVDEFSDIISSGVNEFLKLKPIQMNFIQNSIITMSLNLINELRSLDAYASNYAIIDDSESESHNMNKHVEHLNLSVLQSLLVLRKVFERCLSYNGLYPLSNDFLRRIPLQLMAAPKEMVGMLEADIGMTIEEIEEKQPPVKFPDEYINDSVAADDEMALKFLVNYYNFNFFSGRLPIDIKVEFKCTNDEYLSSNDASRYLLKNPTIYLHPLIKGNKTLISRLILDECCNIFDKWANRFKYDASPNITSLYDLLDVNLNKKINKHILNCIEQAVPWPFHFDNLHYLAKHYKNTVKDLEKKYGIDLKDNLGDIFKNINPLCCNLDAIMTDLIKRDDIEVMWDNKQLPIRQFIASLQCGIHDLSYVTIANPNSIKATCQLSINEINYLENKFKDQVEVSFNLDTEGNAHLGHYHNKLSSLLYLEGLKIIECAFDELREESIKNTLISTRDLSTGVTKLTQDLKKVVSNVSAANGPAFASTSLAEGIKERAASIQGGMTQPGAEGDELERLNEVEYTISNLENVMVRSTNTVMDVLNDLESSSKDVYVYKVYQYFNEKLFDGVLPSLIEISFVDGLDDLSKIVRDVCGFGNPVILLNNLIEDELVLKMQMVIQMVNLSFMYTNHSIEHDAINHLNFPFRSAFKISHVDKTNYFKNKMLPLSCEARLKAEKAGGSEHNKSYIKLLQESTDFLKDNKSVNDLEIDEFIDQVLNEREKMYKGDDDKYKCNLFEEYHTLKAFVTHYINWKKIREGACISDVDTLLKDKNNPINTSPSSQEHLGITSEDVLTIFHPKLLRDIWVRNKLQAVQQSLDKIKLRLPLLNDIDPNWYQHLDDKQQVLVMKYIAIDSTEDDNLFTILTNSKACDQKSAMQVILNIIYEGKTMRDASQSEHDKDLSSSTDNSTPKLSAKDGSDVTSKTSEEDDTTGEREDLSNDLEDELNGLFNTMDEDTLGVVNLLIEKLLNRHFNEARNIINSTPRKSYIVEMAIKALAIMNKYTLVEDAQYNEIIDKII